MRTRPQTLLPTVLALAFVSLLVAPLAALAGSPAVSMYPEAARPGSTVELIGIDFPAENVVEVQLTTPDGTMALATTATDDKGSFAEMVALPFSPTEGNWQIQATAVDGTTSAYGFDTITVADAAGAEPVVQPAAEPAPVAAAPGNSSGDIALMLIIAVVLGGVAFGAMIVYRQVKDETPPGMGRGDDLIWGGGSAETPQQTATDEPYWKNTQGPQGTQPTQAEPSES